MIRKVTGKARTLRSIFLFIATLSVLVTVAAIAQMTGTRQAQRKTHVELQNAIAPPPTRGRSIQPGQEKDNECTANRNEDVWRQNNYRVCNRIEIPAKHYGEDRCRRYQEKVNR